MLTVTTVWNTGETGDINTRMFRLWNMSIKELQSESKFRTFSSAWFLDGQVFRYPVFGKHSSSTIPETSQYSDAQDNQHLWINFGSDYCVYLVTIKRATIEQWRWKVRTKEYVQCQNKDYVGTCWSSNSLFNLCLIILISDHLMNGPLGHSKAGTVHCLDPVSVF